MKNRNKIMLPVGIDIAKKKIDVWMNDKLTSLQNEEKAVGKFFKSISRKDVKIVMEATGRYHRLAHRVLDNLGYEVMVINPFQSRHFAKSMGVLCKTDKVDAKVLSEYAQRMNFKKTPVLSKNEQELQNLVRYLDDLKGVLEQYQQRLEYAEGATLRSLKRLIESTKNEIKKITQLIEKLINHDEGLRQRSDILTSIPGVGKATAAVLIGLVRELGNISNREAAALTGLAPMNFESGRFAGKRRIQMGRHDVRRFLYMPIVGAATTHNSALKKLYQRLRDAGKPVKVALTACMRKLIIFANALLKKGVKWIGNDKKESSFA